MTNQERPSLEEYCRSIAESSNERLFKSEKFYASYFNGLVSQVKNGIFSELVSHLVESQNDYISPEYLFLTDPSESTLHFKSLPSVLNKLYRINVIKPKRWPPQGGGNTIELENAHEGLEDLFRTRFICRYLDGPKFACESLNNRCRELNVEAKYRAVTTALGYHAWHFYYRQTIEDFNGRGEAQVWVELQFTTQLAEVISSLTHFQYESQRLGEEFEEDWRWNVNSKQFRPFYIAHGLHLLEGIILEYRDAVHNQHARGGNPLGTEEENGR